MNRLQFETSPYLLQHAENPVDWYAWDAAALGKARLEDKPILLSIGYSACHWCHVMAHESFEDPETAAIMNDLFVNIKVDREERPDLDDIYMQATQIFQQGRGGWPMTVFLTPDGRPFHAGTYYPPQPRYGMPSFKQVLAAVAEAYQNRREEVEHGAAQVAGMLQANPTASAGDAAFSVGLLNGAAHALIAHADMMHGGLHTGAPKFPSPMNLEYLLRYYAHTHERAVLEVVSFTLRKMANGGIYDQLGYGFHRYSVDEQWLVPHFEKMLYDNAQLARVYLHAYQATDDQFFARICQQILTYVEREMLDPSGGFYSTQDADSEGEEGKFFIWTPEEVEAVLLGDLEESQIATIMRYWDISAAGNFEGSNIPHVEEADDDPDFLANLETARQKLFAEREKRVKPGRDEKMLAAWNGMMLAAFAEAARIFPDLRGRYTEIAERNAEFLLTALSMPDGRLYRTHKAGESKLNGYLEDYACVIDGLLELYQTTFETRWFNEAQRLTDHALAHFAAEDGGFYDTSDDHEQLIARPRSLQDNATPSGGSLLAYDLIRMGAYTGQPEYEAAALPILRQVLSAVMHYPSAFGQSLSAINLLVRRPVEVAVVGSVEEARPLLETIQKPLRPTVITALSPTDVDGKAQPQLLAHRTKRGGMATVYVCQNFACAAPVNTIEEVEKLLAGE